MNEEYTPTTDAMRYVWADRVDKHDQEGADEFERWLAAIEREAAAKALIEFAVELERCDMPERGVHVNMTQYREGLIDGVSQAMRVASRRAAEIQERKNDE